MTLRRGGSSAIVSPLWRDWLIVAERSAARSENKRPPDEAIDYQSASLAGETRERPEQMGNGAEETREALVAINTAAFAIDCFYGSAKHAINPPESTAARERQILECLKLGFAIGAASHEWLDDLDWLFDLRRGSVHHSDSPSDTVVVRTTEETVVAGSAETARFNAVNARRAATLARRITETCLSRPKKCTAEWVAAATRGDSSADE